MNGHSSTLENSLVSELCGISRYCPILDALPEIPSVRKSVIFRAAGDGYLQVEYGTIQTFDLMDAFRLFTVISKLEDRKIPGLIEFGQGFRTLTLRYDALQITYRQLIEQIKEIEESIEDVTGSSFSSRLVTLPIVFEDSATKEAVDRYRKFIRSDAPNLAGGYNIKYTAEYNGLSIDELKQKFLGTEWLLVHQLFFPGGTYQLPIDPRSAIEAPKYNPVRTYTPEGTVGVGGQCVYIYTTESPGGYQMIGRTIPTYQLSRGHPAFKDRPFLLQSSDRIRYVETVEDRLREIYQLVHEEKSSSYIYDIQEGVFRVKDWVEFVSRSEVRREVGEFEEKKRDAQKNVAFP